MHAKRNEHELEADRTSRRNSAVLAAAAKHGWMAVVVLRQLF
jgi:hypothetical protein